MNDEKEFAIKIIEKNSLDKQKQGISAENYEQQQKLEADRFVKMKNLEKEINLLQNINHPYIVR